jgi:hypothetical protein
MCRNHRVSSLVGSLRKADAANQVGNPRLACSDHLSSTTSAGRREDFVRSKLWWCGERHRFPAGASRRTSSDQLSTTFTCVTADSCSLALIIRNRWPSGLTS